MKDPDRKDLQEIFTIVKRFLLANGGMSNGYQTYAEGDVRIDTSSHLKISIPHSDDMTKRQLTDLGRKLYLEVQKYMENVSIRRTAAIDIGHEYTEHGCYKLKVSFTLSEVNWL